MAVTVGERELFVTQFIPMPPEGLISDKVVANVEQARKQIRHILYGPACEGIAHTAYGLVQAAGEYLDHVRRYRNQAATSPARCSSRSRSRPRPCSSRAR